MAGTSQQFYGGVTFSGSATTAINAFRFVKHATTSAEDYKFAVAGASDTACGVAIAGAAIGDEVGVALTGIGLLTVNGATGGAIAAGDGLTAAADGIGVKAGAGSKVFAKALEPATADDVYIRVLIVDAVTLPAACTINTLAELEDVDLGTLANGDVLEYNSTSSKWENKTQVDTLAELEDVDLGTLVNGDVLEYNSTSSKWENKVQG